MTGTNIAVLRVMALMSVSLSLSNASVYMPSTTAAFKTAGLQSSLVRHRVRWALKYQQASSVHSLGSTNSAVAAMAIPGYGVTEQVVVGGFQNFLSIYNIIITVRILLSWFPQAQGVGALQPVYAITDPYLNLFRGIIPPVFGLDLSPIAAFFLLNVVSSATAAVGSNGEMSRAQLRVLEQQNKPIRRPFAWTDTNVASKQAVDRLMRVGNWQRGNMNSPSLLGL